MKFVACGIPLLKVDYVICVLKKNDPGIFQDNLEGSCCKCGRAVIFRPNAPSDPPKICIDCVKTMVEDDGKDKN